MSGYDVEPCELFAAQAMVRDAASQARSELARLQSAAADLLGPRWRGPAASAFDRGWLDWCEGVHSMLAALDETAQALGITAVEYEQNETGISLDLRRIA